MRALLNSPGSNWGRSDEDGKRCRGSGYTLAAEFKGFAGVLEVVW